MMLLSKMKEIDLKDSERNSFNYIFLNANSSYHVFQCAQITARFGTSIKKIRSLPWIICNHITAISVNYINILYIPLRDHLSQACSLWKANWSTFAQGNSRFNVIDLHFMIVNHYIACVPFWIPIAFWVFSAVSSSVTNWNIVNICFDNQHKELKGIFCGSVCSIQETHGVTIPP